MLPVKMVQRRDAEECRDCISAPASVLPFPAHTDFVGFMNPSYHKEGSFFFLVFTELGPTKVHLRSSSGPEGSADLA